MTKDGRPSRINDIRLFFGEHCAHLHGQEEAVAYGRRIAWFLNGAGFSLGAFPALYVQFTPSEEIGSAQVANRHAEWWHRYVTVGVPPNFPNAPDTTEIATRGILAALSVVRPDQAELLCFADSVVRDEGEHLRFLLKRSETRKLITDISFNIEPHPKPSHLFISQTDKASGTYSEADPITLGWYLEGFDLVHGITLRDTVNLIVKQSKPVLSGLVKRRS